MENRIAIIAIVVEDPNSVEKLNGLLHDFREWIIGRMGLPCPGRKISLISVAVDAPQNAISSLAGKVGALKGVSVSTLYSKAGTNA